MANATNISRVLDIVRRAADEDRVVLVCSAISGCTDELIAVMEHPQEKECRLAALEKRHGAIVSRLFTGAELRSVNETLGEFFREMASTSEHLETYGELLSTTIIAAKLRCEEQNVLWVDARDKVRVRGGRVDTEETYRKVRAVVEDHPQDRIIVIPGFIARDEDSRPCNLGRGGSDYSAALFAAAVGADILQIWTDVPGVMTTNPKDAKAARTIASMSYASALCMAEHGAKVLYAPSVAPAMDSGIPIEVRNTFDAEGAFTTISDLPGGGRRSWVGLSRSGGRLCLTADGAAADERDRVVSALKEAGISPVGLSVGENCMEVEVLEGVAVQACAALHKEFFEEAALQRIDLYVAGNGAVGRELKKLVEEGGAAARCGREIRLVAISSDRSFAEKVLKEAPRRSVFVDCTNSEDIYRWYVPILESGINIVSSNRRSLAVSYVEYAAMKQAALRGGSFLRYESTVGAALPMLEMLNVCIQSGDRIESLEAVVSCTLNYILSSKLPFKEALEDARRAGLTEKDPSSDLEGRDALRKLLILAREAGVPLEAGDVHVEAVTEDAVTGGNQRFVATLERDGEGYRASIKLKTVEPSHPAYWLRGTDNAIIIRSALHPSPMVLQGAGEGARLAAASILNDILL